MKHFLFDLCSAERFGDFLLNLKLVFLDFNSGTLLNMGPEMEDLGSIPFVSSLRYLACAMD